MKGTCIVFLEVLLMAALYFNYKWEDNDVAAAIMIAAIFTLVAMFAMFYELLSHLKTMGAKKNTEDKG